MNKILLMALLAVSIVQVSWAGKHAAASRDDLGWTPAQTSEWQGIQVEYALAVKHYGLHSPQANAARIRKDRMAKLLKASTRRPAPEPVVCASCYNPGTNGTIAPPQWLENTQMVLRN
jgi:hypothetical protein